MRVILALVTLGIATFVAASPCGDLVPSGTTDVADAVAALRRAVGTPPPSPAEIAEADVAPVASVDETTVPPTATPRPDGVLDVADVVQLLRLSVGLVALPGCAPAASERPRVAHVTPDEACDGAEVVVSISNPDGLPTGGIFWSSGIVIPLGEQARPGGSDVLVRLDALTDFGLGRVELEEGVGRVNVFTRDCSSPPVLLDVHPDGVVTGSRRPLGLFGHGLLCATRVRLIGPSGQADAVIARRFTDSILEVLVPAGPWPAGEVLDVAVENPCGSEVLSGAWVVEAAAAPAPDATTLTIEGGAGSSMPGTQPRAVLLEGTALQDFELVRFGDRDVLRGSGCDWTGAAIRCDPPVIAPHAWVTVPVTVMTAQDADATPLELTWTGSPAPRCGDVSPLTVAPGPATITIVGEHLQHVTSVTVDRLAFPATPSADGRTLTADVHVPLTSRLRVDIDLPGSSWDVTCPVTVQVQ